MSLAQIHRQARLSGLKGLCSPKEEGSETLASWKFCTAYLGHLDSVSSTPVPTSVPKTQFPVFHLSCDKARSSRQLTLGCKADCCAHSLMPPLHIVQD